MEAPPLPLPLPPAVDPCPYPQSPPPLKDTRRGRECTPATPPTPVREGVEQVRVVGERKVAGVTVREGAEPST
jgi:hypothetical protein